MSNKPNEAVQEPMRVAAVQNVTKVYRLGGQDVKALAGVSLEFKQGDFVAIMGSSGSGKSTLLNLLGCLDRPTTGHYLLGGRDVATLSDERPFTCSWSLSWFCISVIQPDSAT